MPKPLKTETQQWYFKLRAYSGDLHGLRKTWSKFMDTCALELKSTST